jgi:hypothetical protein
MYRDILATVRYSRLRAETKYSFPSFLPFPELQLHISMTILEFDTSSCPWLALTSTWRSMGMYFFKGNSRDFSLSTLLQPRPSAAE